MRSRLRPFSRFLLLLAATAALAGMAFRVWYPVRTGARRLAGEHLHFQVAHPGWSFPARVWSAATPLDIPKARLLEEARIRGYTEQCPPAEPGRYCRKTGEVNPRGGLFPEGVQPPGTTGWTRPLALEPILLGVLVGPDAEIREHLPIQKAPRLLLDAIVQAEDMDYYRHHGVNLVSGLRAAWVNLRAGGYRHGGSTLTMQVVRNWSGRKEKVLSRKIWESMTAWELDRYLGKEKVLQAYLDAPYLGQSGNLSVCGFQAAARYYWGKDAWDLSLSEAATLAGILPAPGKYAPDRNPKAAKERRDLVLHRMAAIGYDVAKALEEPVEASPHDLPPDRYPAYLQAVRAWLEETLPPATVYGAGLDVFTALEPFVQETGDQVLADRIAFLDGMLGGGRKQHLLGAATILDRRTGLLVAVNDGKLGQATDFSRATQARRQPGSSFKPVVYALAFSMKDPAGRPLYTSSHALPNAPRVFAGTNGWSPRNISGEYSATSSLANALAWSQNIATATLLEELGGPQPIITFAQRMGYDTSRWPHEMGLALGQAEVTVLEMARFVTTVSSGGFLASGSPVLVAVDPSGRERIPRVTLGERVLSEEAAALTRDLMRLVVEFGTGGRVRGTGGFAGYPGPVIGKTGTTDGEKDVWFIGSTPYYGGALWLGYEIPDRLGASASDLAAPLWGWWMKDVHKGLPVVEFDGMKLEHRGICTVSGKVPNGTCRIISAPFAPGTGPSGACPHEHVWPPETEDDEVLAGEETDPENQKKWKSLWDRLAAEKEAAEGGAEGDGPDGAPAAPGTETATEAPKSPQTLRPPAL